MLGFGFEKAIVAFPVPILKPMSLKYYFPPIFTLTCYDSKEPVDSVHLSVPLAAFMPKMSR